MKVLETENQRLRRGKDLERFTELAQHPGLRDALHSFLQSLELLIGNEAWHLHQPRRCVLAQDGERLI
ncbi:MAG TPA: hypothetical protein VLL57_07265, partial [Candidatus Binataceae bacterium]|nr:hypothetical protein [Candidatus Binataceae bacterium]